VNNYSHEKKTMWVVLIGILTMGLEIGFGITTNSMALLSDGIHMGSHVFAIGISWAAYRIVKRVSQNESFTGSPDKILSLSGYSNGMVLLIFAGVIMFESIKRFYNPQIISYKEAIIVAIIGLIVNTLSAVILHHREEHSDHNIRAAYLHVIADAITSLSAIIGLIVSWKMNIPYIDTIAAVVSSLVIIRWAVGLLKATGSSLIDIQ
jgi:cobalt-zinc-cadmium efflux system protein